jgi:hypothetical protein
MTNDIDDDDDVNLRIVGAKFVTATPITDVDAELDKRTAEIIGSVRVPWSIADYQRDYLDKRAAYESLMDAYRAAKKSAQDAARVMMDAESAFESARRAAEET